MNTNSITLTNLKKAVADYKAYNTSPDRSLHAHLILDRSTGELWCNVHTDENTVTVYDDKAIINLGTIVDEWALDQYATKKHIYSAAKIAKYARNEILAYATGKQTCDYDRDVPAYIWHTEREGNQA